MRLSVLIRGLGSAALLLGTVGFSGSAAFACGSSYKVERGDHLGRIAKNCGVSVEEILKANKLRDPSMLRVGQDLVIPGGAQSDKPVKKSANADGGTEIRGEIINGRYCAQIVTEDGNRFGLVSPKLAFTSGKIVTVRGSMHKYAGCTPDKTMLVTAIIEDGVDATDLSTTINVGTNFTN